MDKQRNWFLEMKSQNNPGKDAMTTVEMATKDLEYNINLVDKVVGGFERLTPILKVLLWVKCYQASLHATKKSFMKDSQSIQTLP